MTKKLLYNTVVIGRIKGSGRVGPFNKLQVISRIAMDIITEEQVERSPAQFFGIEREESPNSAG
jgi:hypothetical protein